MLLCPPPPPAPLYPNPVSYQVEWDTDPGKQEVQTITTSTYTGANEVQTITTKASDSNEVRNHACLFGSVISVDVYGGAKTETKLKCVLVFVETQALWC